MSMLNKLCDTRNALEGKVLAIAMSLIMAFSFINISAFADAADEATSDVPVEQTDEPSGDMPQNESETSAPEETPDVTEAPVAPEAPAAVEQPAQNEAPKVETPEPSTDAPVADPGVAVVGLDFAHAYVKYLDQTIALPTASMNVPLNKELSFSAFADEGFEIDSVKTVVDGVETRLAADEQTGQYKIPAEHVTSNLTIVVVAKEVAKADVPAAEGVQGEEASGSLESDNAASPFSLRASNVVNVAVGEEFTITGSDGPYNHIWYVDYITWPSDLSFQDMIAITGDSYNQRDLTGVGKIPGTMVVKHNWVDSGFNDRTETFTIVVGESSSADSTKLTLAPESVVLEKGSSTVLRTIFEPASGSSAVTWSSSNKNIATVSGGTVTAVKAGTVTITAKAGSLQATAQVEVIGKVTNVREITISGDSQVSVGGTTQLSASVETTDGAAAPSVTWSSSNPSAATVDGTGLVTGVLGGSTIISATAGGVTTQHVVSVVAYTVSFYSNYPSDAEKYALDGKVNGGQILPANDTYAVYQMAPTERSFTAIEGYNCTNYTFKGWNSKPDGSGVAYQPGDSVPVTQNVQLFAQWSDTPHDVEKVTVQVSYYYGNKSQVANTLKAQGVKNDDGTITFQLHKQETANVKNPKSELYAWALGSEDGERFPLGSICTTSQYTVGKNNQISVKAYGAYGTDKTAEFFVLKPSVTDLSGNIGNKGNYYYAGTGTIIRTGIGTIDYKTDAFKNVNEYIVTAPSANAIADIINIGIDQAQSIRWYKITREDNAWHVDGMLYTVGQYWNVNYYDHGELVKTEIVQDGGGFNILGNAPAVSGDGFDAWRYANGAAVASGSENITGNVNVYSKYKDRFNVIALIDDGGTVEPASQQVYADSASSEIAFSASEGHHIASITETRTDASGEGKQERTIDVTDDKTYTYPEISSVDANYTIAVTTKADTFSVAYDLAGGQTTSPYTSFEELEYGTTTPTIDEPTRTGYAFVGWDTEIAPTVTSNVVYTAKWERDDEQTHSLSYTVEYYKNGSIDKDKTATVSKDVWVNETMIPVSADDINKDDAFGPYYEFTSTDPSVMPSEVADGAVIKVYYVGTEDSLAYDGNGADSGAVTAAVGRVGEDVTVAQNGFERLGYRFEGWNTQEDGKGTPYAPGTSFTLTEDRDVLYAQWKEASPVALIYQAEAGGMITDNKGTAAASWSEAVNPATGEATGSTAQPNLGYRFVGWFVGDQMVSDQALLDKDAVDSVARTTGIYTSATFVAKFEESDEVTLTYVAGEGGVVDRASETLAPATGTAEGSTAAAKPGYHFVKWTTSVDGEDVEVSASEKLSSNDVTRHAKDSGVFEPATFTAHFAENTADITYVAEGPGSVSQESETLAVVSGVTVGSKALSKPTTENDLGSYFIGWSVGDSEDIISTEPVLSGEMVKQYAKSGDLFVSTTFTAHFAEKKPLTIFSKSDTFVYDGTPHVARDTDFRGSYGLAIYNVTAIAEEVDAGTYPVKFYDQDKLKIVEASTAKDVTDQYAVTYEEGTLTIKKRPIAVTGEGWAAPQQYTGKPYTSDKYKVQGPDGFSDWQLEGTQGLVWGQTLKTNYLISGTNPGSYAGAFDDIVIFNGDADVTKNYEIAQTVGKLEIVASKQPVVITAASESWKYDGQAHSDNGYAVSYGETPVAQNADGSYTLPTGDKVTATVAGSVTHVADGIGGNNKVTGFQVENSDRYTNVSSVDGTLTITPRAVDLISASGIKEYDGTPLRADNVEVSGDGFVSGEGASYAVTGSQTAVGFAKNDFTYTLNEGTMAEDYAITQYYGKLTVTSRPNDAKFEITVKANSNTFTYDGTEKSVSGLEQTEFVFNGVTFTVTGLDASVAATNAGTYDANVIGDPVVTDEEGNVVTDQFIIRSKDGSLTIEQRPLTLQSDTLSKPFDGTPLINGTTPLKVEQGWADGEGATYEFTNSVSQPGETKKNAFTVKPNDGTNLDNYMVTKTEGQLTILNRDAKYDVTVTANSFSDTYDGTEKSVSGLVGETAQGVPVQADGRTYYVKGLTAHATGTNVADSTVVPVEGIAQVVDENNNDVSSEFKVTTVPGSLTINKRPVTLASKDLSKEYDGTALTNGENELATQDGWASGEGATYRFTGSVTLPGATAPNAFEIVPNAGTNLDNYKVDKTEGTLRVTNRDAQYEVTLTANSLSETYDGTTKSVSGFVGEENGAVAVQAGDQTYYVSGLTASASGTNADTYQTVIEGTAVVADAAGNVVTDQFDVNTIGGSLVIDKRPVTLQSASDEKPYDGTPLENHAVDVTAGSWANDEGATYRFTGSVTLPGETAPNAFEIVPNAGTNLDNYNLRKIEGQLTILNRDAKYDVTVTANSFSDTYDGTEKKVSGFENETDQGIPVVADGRTYYVKGLTSSASGTNADTYQTTIAGTAVVVDAAGNVVTGQFNVKTVDGSLVIDKRVVDLISASDEKPYDGTPLTNDTVDVMGDGWAPGQGASYNVTGSQTVVGFSDNTFTYVLTGGASEENYTITPMFGSLRVYNADAKFEVTVAANSDTVTYDGEQHAVSGLVSETDKGVLVQANGLDFYVSGLSASAEGTDANTYAANVVGTPVVKDAADNDVTDQFDVKTVGGSLTIEKRTVTMTSATAEKYYDGTPLKDSTVTVPEGSWADGEGATYQVTGSQTKIGSSPNTFTYTLTGATKAENYNINPVEGALTVKSRDAKFDLTLEANSLAATYDGTEKSVSGLKQTEFTIDGATFTVSGVTAEAKGIDARVYQVVPRGDVKIVDSEGNDVTDQFNVTFKEGSLTIEKRPLTLTSATLSKPYDGTPLTNGDTPLYLEQGWAEGEGATYEFTESVTLPGATASNEFNIHANAGTKLENYAITKSVGQLTIEDRNEDAKYAIDLEANSDTFLYDGQQKSVDGFVQTEFAFGGVTYTVTGLAASATRTDAGTTTVGISGTPVVKDAAGNDVTSQFKITLVPGTLKVDKRSVVLESATDSKPYDGTELVNDNVAVAGDGWADGEGAAYNVTGSQTLVGFSSNTFTYALTGGTKAENYSIDTREGTLTVTNRDAKYEATVEANSATFQYDGEKKTVSGFKNETVDGIPVQVGALTYYVSGLTASAELTDAGTVQVKATGNPTVRDAAGNDVTSEFNIKSVAGSLSVEKRQVNLTSATDTKEYDGEALVAHDVIVSGDGWADGEGASYSYTGSQTLVGSSPNHFEATLNANTKAENYTMKLIEGTLTVTNRNAAFNVTVKAASDTALYDGSEHDVSGFENETAQGIPVLAGGNTYYVTGLSANAAGTDAGTYVARVAGTPVVLDAAGNDVSDQFSVTPEADKLVVSKRSVVLQSGSGTKAYDGTELVNHNIAVSGDGWATGEGADYSFTGTQTLVGTSDNMFDYALNGGAKAENYQIDKRYGSLTVTNRGAQYAVTVTANSATVTYDGTEQSVAGLQNQTDQGVAVQADGRTYYVSGLAADVAGTNAGTYTATVSGTPVVRDADGNDVSDQFAVTTQPGSLVIEQRPLTLESANLSKKYDGRPLTNGSEPLAVKDGWATGEGAAYVFTGSATLPGETAPNAFVIKVNDGTNLDNYVVSKVEGQLSVENRDARYDATVTAQSGTFTYDGTAHAVDGFVDQTAQGIPVQADGQTYYVSGLTSKASGANVADSMATIPVEGVAVVKDADGNDVSDQFNIKVQAGSFTIDPAELVIAANDTGKRYGDGDPALTASVSGLVAGDTFNGSYVLTRTAGENAGTYDITVSDVQLGALSNYTATTLTGRFIIAPAGEVTLVVNDSSKTYDGTPLEPSGFNPIGLAPGDTVEVTYGGSQTDAGTSEGTITDYVIRNAAGEDVTANYPTINIEPGTLRVDPMQVVITVDDASKTAGSADPVFSGSVQGLVNPDDLGAITYVRTGAGTDEAVGVYADAITVDYAANPNYAVTVVPGTFTITAGGTVGPVTPTPATPGTTPPATPTPLPTPGTPPADNPLTPIVTPIVDALANAAETVIGDNATPLAQNQPRETEIEDDGTPLAAGSHAWCWVHWYIILGIIVSVIYAACVALRRGLFSHKLKKYEDDLTGGGDPAPGDPSANDNVTVPLMPKGAPAGATLAAGLGE